MALDALNRRTFVKSATAVGGGVAMGGPLAALGASTAEARKAVRVTGYGPLKPTAEQDSGVVYLELPEGFRYRVVNRSFDPSLAYPTRASVEAGEPQTVPTPVRFDGMGSFAGPDGTTILIRNHEIRGRPFSGDPESEGYAPAPGVVVPPELAYDPGNGANGGLTRLVVDRDRRLVGLPVHVLGGTDVNCAGGVMPWGSWVTCEETDTSPGTTGTGTRAATTTKPHGYCFEMPADRDKPVKAEPIRAAGFFVHEAVAWHDNVLYETEDERETSAFYRYRPNQRITGPGQLARSNGPLEALKIRTMPNADADRLQVGRRYPVEWVPIDNPDPDLAAGEPSTREQAAAKGAARFDRLEGAWESGGKIYFDATEGGSPDDESASGTETRELGQLFEYDPRSRTLRLIFASPSPDVLQNPDNLVVVPTTGHVFLQEDSDGDQYVRGVTDKGDIYDFAKSTFNDSEFCGGCFSADGTTFFLNQQGGNENSQDGSENGLTYAIWGPFETVRANHGKDRVREHDGNGKGKGRGTSR